MPKPRPGQPQRRRNFRRQRDRRRPAVGLPALPCREPHLRFPCRVLRHLTDSRGPSVGRHCQQPRREVADQNPAARNRSVVAHYRNLRRTFRAFLRHDEVDERPPRARVEQRRESWHAARVRDPHRHVSQPPRQHQPPRRHLSVCQNRAICRRDPAPRQHKAAAALTHREQPQRIRRPEMREQNQSDPCSGLVGSAADPPRIQLRSVQEAIIGDQLSFRERRQGPRNPLPVEVGEVRFDQPRGLTRIPRKRGTLPGCLVQLRVQSVNNQRGTRCGFELPPAVLVGLNRRVSGRDFVNNVGVAGCYVPCCCISSGHDHRLHGSGAPDIADQIAGPTGKKQVPISAKIRCQHAPERSPCTRPFFRSFHNCKQLKLIHQTNQTARPATIRGARQVRRRVDRNPHRIHIQALTNRNQHSRRQRTKGRSRTLLDRAVRCERRCACSPNQILPPLPVQYPVAFDPIRTVRTRRQRRNGFGCSRMTSENKSGEDSQGETHCRNLATEDFSDMFADRSFRMSPRRPALPDAAGHVTPAVSPPVGLL